MLSGPHRRWGDAERGIEHERMEHGDIQPTPGVRCARVLTLNIAHRRDASVVQTDQLRAIWPYQHKGYAGVARRGKRPHPVGALTLQWLAGGVCRQRLVQ